MIKTNLQIIEQLRMFLEESSKSGIEYRKNPSDFSRTRKLPFERVVSVLINLPKKSLSLEIGELFDHLEEEQSITKSAFSQARYKLKHKFFRDWNDELKKVYYTDNEDRVERWKDFILLGVDGSTLHLFEDQDGLIAEHFGKHGGAVTGRVMCMYDVLNNISYKNELDSIHVSENEIAKNWLSQLQKDKQYLGDVLCLYDMKYIGFSFAYEHVNQGLEFVMRVERTFNTLVYDFANSNKMDSIEKWYPSENGLAELRQKGYSVNENSFIDVRLIKVELPKGETEILVSSLLNRRKYPLKTFGPLYFKRWGSETNFDKWKNKVQIENFSGHSVEAIYQDFYATIFTSNIHSLIIGQCHEEVVKLTDERILDYAINKNVSLGILKGNIIKLFLCKDPARILKKLHKMFIVHLEPIRPNRAFPRNKRIIHLNGKYVTMTNYRRCV